MSVGERRRHLELVGDPFREREPGVPSDCCGFQLFGRWAMSRRVVCTGCLRFYLADVDPATGEHVWRTDDGPTGEK